MFAVSCGHFPLQRNDTTCKIYWPVSLNHHEVHGKDEYIIITYKGQSFDVNTNRSRPTLRRNLHNIIISICVIYVEPLRSIHRSQLFTYIFYFFRICMYHLFHRILYSISFVQFLSIFIIFLFIFFLYFFLSFFNLWKSIERNWNDKSVFRFKYRKYIRLK